MLFLLSGCIDVITPNISEDIPTLIAPSDSLQTATQNHTFWWDGVEYADAYRLQIVTPRFDSVNALILDTLVTDTQYPFTLTDGNYEWRVIAENVNYVSDYQVNRLFIDGSIPSVPILLSPGDCDTLNLADLPLDLSWTADQDVVQDSIFIYSDSLTTLFAVETSMSQTISFTTTSVGSYYWQVRSIDAVGNASNLSAPRKIIVQ